MTIVLSGYMGSGKSLIGNKLAQHLRLKFIDLDDEITSNQKMSIPEIFSEKGEIGFRKIEMEVLKRTLDTSKNIVLALGGGTPCYGTNINEIKNRKNTRLIYLKTDLEVLTERLFAEKDTRPLIKDIATKEELKDFIRKHLFERQHYYYQSDFTVDCSEAAPEEIVEHIIEKI